MLNLKKISEELITDIHNMTDEEMIEEMAEAGATLKNIIKQGELRAEKIAYPDGIGCCVWYPIDSDERVGICFDFPFEDINDFILILQKLKEIEATEYNEDDNSGNQ